MKRLLVHWLRRSLILGMIGVLLMLGILRPWPGETVHPLPSLLQLQKLADLVVLRVHVQQIVEQRIKGYTGSVAVILLVRGDVALTTDLSQARWDAVDPQAHTATLRLPAPHPAFPRVDQDQTRVISIHRSGLWLIVPTAQPETTAISRAMQQAQAAILTAADGTTRQEARRHAEEVLTGFCKPLGWSVRVEWD